MVTFTIALIVLIAGYFIYGGYVNRVFGPDDRKTPAITNADGVDFVALPTRKIFMIQFLNIAGLGPIFGAIMGAQFGTASYLWIVLGTIFAGAVHDFFSGTLSIRNGGESHSCKKFCWTAYENSSDKNHQNECKDTHYLFCVVSKVTSYDFRKTLSPISNG